MAPRYGHPRQLRRAAGGHGYLVRRNPDRRAILWLGGAGILGVLLDSWLFTSQFLPQFSTKSPQSHGILFVG
jgi:hypothetical protein